MIFNELFSRLMAGETIQVPSPPKDTPEFTHEELLKLFMHNQAQIQRHLIKMSDNLEEIQRELFYIAEQLPKPYSLNISVDDFKGPKQTEERCL